MSAAYDARLVPRVTSAAGFFGEENLLALMVVGLDGESLQGPVTGGEVVSIGPENGLPEAEALDGYVVEPWGLYEVRLDEVEDQPAQEDSQGTGLRAGCQTRIVQGHREEDGCA